MATYTFRLTATGIAEMKRDLEQLGPAGQAAFQRIEQGAQQAATGSRNFGQLIGQAGFQLQDFTVQVQNGTSALTALAQQGSQFLGIFGAGGAIAGAALAVGAVALQMAGLGRRTEESTDEAKKLNEELRRSLEIMTGMESVSANVARNLRASIEARVRAANETASAAAQADIDALFTTDEFGNRVLRGDRTPAQLAEAQRRLNRASQSVRLEPILRQAEAGYFDGGETARTRQGDQLARDIANQDAKARREREQKEEEAREREANANAQFRERQNRADVDALIRRLDQEKREKERAEKAEADRREAFRQQQNRADLDALIERVQERERLELRQLADVQQSEEKRRLEFERQTNRTVERVVDFGADALYDAWTGRIDDIGQFLKQTLLRSVAQGLSEAAFRPIIQSIVGQVYSAVGYGPGQGGGGSGGLSSFNLGGGSFTSTANQFLFGGTEVTAFGNGLDFASTAGLLGEGGTFLGSQFAADAFLPGIGSAIPGLVSGNYVQAGLGLAGSVVGTAIGGPIGGAIGGTLGNLVGGMFGGGGRGDPYSQGSIALGADGRLSGYAAADNLGDPAKLQAQIDQALAQLDAITKARGLVYTQGAALFGDRTDRTLEQALDEIASGIRPGAGASARVRSTLDAGGITSLQGLVDALNKADQIDAFTESVRRATLAITDADALALEDQDKVAQARLAQARELGLDIADVERLNGLERARLVEQQAEAQTAILEAANENLRQQSEDAFALILSGAAERRRQAEDEARAQQQANDAIRQAWASSAQSMIDEAQRLRQEVDDALLGQYSNLSPEARLALAGDRFRAGSLALNDYLAEGAGAYGTATTAYASFFEAALSTQRARADAISASAYSRVPGFATGGSFDVPGPAGNDNVYMPSLGARFTRGETVNVSRRDTMATLVARADQQIAVMQQLLAAIVVIGGEQLAVSDQVRRSIAGMEAVTRNRKAAG